jgi:hypothetical protein
VRRESVRKGKKGRKRTNLLEEHATVIEGLGGLDDSGDQGASVCDAARFRTKEKKRRNGQNNFLEVTKTRRRTFGERVLGELLEERDEEMLGLLHLPLRRLPDRRESVASVEHSVGDVDGLSRYVVVSAVREGRRTSTHSLDDRSHAADDSA